MRNHKLFLLTAFFIATLISGCKPEDTPTGRDAILGTYDFTNTYTLIKQTTFGMDTTQATDTYIITINKPNPDSLGDNIVWITNFSRERPSATIEASLSSAGDVLSATMGIADVEFYNFQGVKSGNNVQFTYKAYGQTPSGSETGAGTAVKR